MLFFISLSKASLFFGSVDRLRVLLSMMFGLKFCSREAPTFLNCFHSYFNQRGSASTEQQSCQRRNWRLASSAFRCSFNPAMATDESNSLIEQRKAKLASLRAKGIDPFRNKFTPKEKCAEARANYAEGREVSISGRVTAHREMGKSMFIDVRDQSGRLQVYAQKNILGDEQFDIFRHLDLGDFIGATGTLFTTKTGEISARLNSFTILAKALRPPPEKWHGLADTEIRY